MMKKILLLGAGRVGKAIADDLVRDFKVAAVDSDPRNLDQLTDGVDARQANLTDPDGDDTLRKICEPFDLVVSALPGHLGCRTLEHLIEFGKDIVDISFMPENPLSLDRKAKKRNVTALVDFGVAPGLNNFILGQFDRRMKVQSFECMVGGLPFKRTLPFEYKAPFSPVDVIEEYVRPARMRVNGREVVRPALSEVESVEVEEVGTLEAFNTDGLRTLLETLPHIPDMKEKTLRYPGHARWMKGLRDAGFFEEKPRDLRGVTVSPIEVTSALLEEKWALEPDEEEFTVMTIHIEGSEEGRKKEVWCRLFDRYDRATGFSSMARTTGYACTGAVRLLLDGVITSKGVLPPELPGSDPDSFGWMMRHLKERGIDIKFTEKTASD